MQALYDWAFSSDGTFVRTTEGGQMLLVVGDKVQVFSDRHRCWFDDGVVECTYRDGIRVRYGLNRYFGFAMSKGNVKFLKTSEIEQKVRVVSSQLKLRKTYADVAKST